MDASSSDSSFTVIKAKEAGLSLIFWMVLDRFVVGDCIGYSFAFIVALARIVGTIETAKTIRIAGTNQEAQKDSFDLNSSLNYWPKTYDLIPTLTSWQMMSRSSYFLTCSSSVPTASAACDFHSYRFLHLHRFDFVDCYYQKRPIAAAN